jgi:hypothetical protein
MDKTLHLYIIDGPCLELDAEFVSLIHTPALQLKCSSVCVFMYTELARHLEYCSLRNR